MTNVKMCSNFRGKKILIFDTLVVSTNPMFQTGWGGQRQRIHWRMLKDLKAGNGCFPWGHRKKEADENPDGSIVGTGCLPGAGTASSLQVVHPWQQQGGPLSSCAL